ncbi:MAG: Rrf2 family transcriptional regulator [Candidatus Bipolaricaulia bacterium]
MIFTKRADYGLRAALELAARYGRGSLSAHQIAEHSELPGPFVKKLLQDLTAAGIAQSRRGRSGGYSLTDAPERIGLVDVLSAFEELAPVRCLAAYDDEEGAACVLEEHATDCPTRAVWQLIDRRVRSALEALTLADLLGVLEGQGLKLDVVVHG